MIPGARHEELESLLELADAMGWDEVAHDVRDEMQRRLGTREVVR